MGLIHQSSGDGVKSVYSTPTLAWPLRRPPPSHAPTPTDTGTRRHDNLGSEVNKDKLKCLGETSSNGY